MLRILQNSRGAMNAQQNKLDIISNNIANIGTNGYKKAKVGFQELLTENLKRKGYPTNDERTDKASFISGVGVKSTAAIRDSSQGSLMPTGEVTDLALDGQGYFKVYLPNGSEAYRRNGEFVIDVNGNLVDHSGNRLSIVDDDGNDINTENIKYRFTKDNLRVNNDGTVLVQINENETKEVGKIVVKDFIGMNSLRSAGKNLYIPNEGVEAIEASDYSIQSGFVETSNVTLEEEMTEMLLTQRAFQVNSSTLKTADEMWGMINNLKR